MSRLLVFTIILVFSELKTATGLGIVIYAVNAGGTAHTDVNGIKYSRDPLHGKIGTASSYGKRVILIGRAHAKDEILYQTERYHYETFGYDIPAIIDGDYVLVLKFCEVYFRSPNQKVFDVVLNGHTIVANLDIFDKVGYGVAHEELIPYSIIKGKLHINGEESDIVGGKIKLEFVKGLEDNPKINAFYVMQGTTNDVPKLPEDENEARYEMEERDEKELREVKLTSGPRTLDPYIMDKTSAFIPVLITIGAAIPILFCLCKL